MKVYDVVVYLKVAKSDLFVNIRHPDFLCQEFLIKMYRLLQNYTFEISILSKIMDICCKYKNIFYWLALNYVKAIDR